MDLLAWAVTKYLNELEQPITKVDLCKTLGLAHWEVSLIEFHGFPDWESKSEKFRYMDSYADTYQRHIYSEYEPSEMMGMVSERKKFRRASNMNIPESRHSFWSNTPNHGVFRLVEKLEKERAVPNGIVFDPIITKEILGFKVSIKESVLYFNKAMIPTGDCMWEISSWWNQFSNFPDVIKRDTCECQDCESWRLEKHQFHVQLDESNKQKARLTRLVNRFKEPVRLHLNNCCMECSKEFTMGKQHCGSSYHCLPKFSNGNEPEYPTNDDFLGLCGSCRQTNKVKEKYGI